MTSLALINNAGRGHGYTGGGGEQVQKNAISRSRGMPEPKEPPPHALSAQCGMQQGTQPSLSKAHEAGLLATLPSVAWQVS